MASSPANLLTKWMSSDDYYVTFDSMTVEKKQPSGDPVQIKHTENGHMTLPMFMWDVNGLMQLSALEAKYDKPLETPKDLRSFADFLKRQDEHSYTIKLTNFHVKRKGMEQINEVAQAATNYWQSVIGLNPFMRGFMNGLGDNPFKNPEIDLGTLAGECAKWMEALDRLPSTARGR